MLTEYHYNNTISISCLGRSLMLKDSKEAFMWYRLKEVILMLNIKLGAIKKVMVLLKAILLLFNGI